MILRRNITRCYDCFTRDKPKTFQVCTLRTLPEKPIHCLVWAKHLFSLMFGPPTDQNLLSDVLSSLDKKLLDTSSNLYSDLYSRVDQVFGKIFSQMLIEQKLVNPEKFEYVKTIDQDVIKICADVSTLPRIYRLTLIKFINWSSMFRTSTVRYA
jgi:hypothetical protein